MNYIKQLQEEIARLQGEKAEAALVLQELEVYLTSPKFHQDATVQVQDVLNRLQGAKFQLMQGATCIKEPDVKALCKAREAAHQAYLVNPTDANFRALEAAEDRVTATRKPDMVPHPRYSSR